MSIIGDEKRFAVEFALDDEPAGEWLNGAIHLWVGGVAVGRLPSTELRSLRDYIVRFDKIVSGFGRRRHSGLFAEPIATAVALLDGALFVGADSTLEQRSIEEQWGLLLLGLGFADGHVYLIEDGEMARLLVSQTRSSHEYRLPAAEVYGVFAKARDELERLRQRALTHDD